MLVDSQNVRPWYVCESTQRWLVALRRFVPEMMPAPLVPLIVPIDDASQLASETVAAPGQRFVAIWEVRRETIAAACDNLARTVIAAPQALQLVAGWGLTDRERILLSEFRSATIIDHPEQMPRISSMIHGYFASSIRST